MALISELQNNIDYKISWTT